MTATTTRRALAISPRISIIWRDGFRQTADSGKPFESAEAAQLYADSQRVKFAADGVPEFAIEVSFKTVSA